MLDTMILMDLSYQIQFSDGKYNRVRYDNHDKGWSVSSNPHHFHPRHTKEAIKSEMIGNPEVDMPKLINVIKQLL